MAVENKETPEKRVTLLDVNILIALFDAGHRAHQAATRWMGEHFTQGWATCPLTENGCVRVLSQSSYNNGTTTADAVRRMRQAKESPYHVFWDDDLSITQEKCFVDSGFLGPKQIMDIYLLGLAVKRGGRLLTMDRRITLRAVKGATDEHLVVLQ